jgi:hypothetical protein
MARISWVLAGVIAVAAIGAAAWPMYFGPRVKAKSLVRSALSDPDSAQFRDLGVDTETGSICGRVNAKNKFGGYVGFKPFALLKDGTLHLYPESGSVADRAEFATNIEHYCAEAL